MSSTITELIPTVRNHLSEVTARFWTDDELSTLFILGIKDLWRDIVDLKGEHYLKYNTTDVSYQASATVLSGVPVDVHKIYLIEARDLSVNGSNHGLVFRPLEFNDSTFQSNRGKDAIDPTDSVIYYSITSQGSPVNAPIIRCAPKVSTTVLLSFGYIPTIDALISAGDPIPIPGDADNALIAWCMAFARAKESENRAPDINWLTIYSTEKSHLLQSLGLRQFQEPEYVSAVFEEYS